MDKFFVGLIVLMSLLFLVGLYYAIEHDNKAEAQAKVIDCKYLGSARDMGEVGFFECGNDIILKRIK